MKGNRHPTRLARRDVLAIAAASVAGSAVIGPDVTAVRAEEGAPRPRTPAPPTASPDARLATARAGDDEGLTWLPAWRIRQLIARGDVSPVEVTEHFLGRIAERDPRLHAFRMVDRDGARYAARRAERAVRSGELLGSLHGIPVALKEHLPARGLIWHDLATGRKQIAVGDSIEAGRLRSAGAIIVGSLAAQGALVDDATEPRNPWDLGRVPGGSSPGSAVAVAAGLLPVAIAADGRGSTRLPAAFCGNVGLRGTRGRVPSVHDGVVNPRLMTESGPMTRDVRDAATVLQVLAGPDGRDIACLQDDAPDYLTELERGARGMRLAWTDDFGYATRYRQAQTPAVVAAVRATAFSIVRAGAQIEAIDTVWEDPDFASRIVLANDPVLEKRIRVRMQQGITTEDVVRAQESRQRIWLTFRGVLRDRDFVVSPTIDYVAPTMAEWVAGTRDPGYAARYTAYTSAANLLGWPAITLPAGLVDGMPVGLQIVGRPDSEPRMLRLAEAYLRLQG